MVGAPTNTNAAGSTLAIIRAVLSTGFNLLTPQSATVASGVMTLTYSAPHGYEDKVLIRLDGAAGGSIVRRVTATAGSSSLTIPAPEFANGQVAGSLSTRVAPADWEEVFTDTGVGVFRSKVDGPGSTRFYYRVADTVSGYNTSMLRGFETMTDANTGTGPFPTVAQQAGNGVLVRRSTGGVFPWAAVADGRTVYLSIGHAIGGAGLFSYVRHFGDAAAFFSGDLFCAYVGYGSDQCDVGGVIFSPRVAAGNGTAISAANYSLFPSGSGLLAAYGGRAYPSSIDGGMVFLRGVPINNSGVQSSNDVLRGTLRGLLHCSANPIASNAVSRVFGSVTGVSGRVAVLRTKGSDGCVAFPIDEDWA